MAEESIKAIALKLGLVEATRRLAETDDMGILDDLDHVHELTVHRG